MIVKVEIEKLRNVIYLDTSTSIEKHFRNMPCGYVCSHFNVKLEKLLYILCYHPKVLVYLTALFPCGYDLGKWMIIVLFQLELEHLLQSTPFYP